MHRPTFLTGAAAEPLPQCLALALGGIAAVGLPLLLVSVATRGWTILAIHALLVLVAWTCQPRHRD